MISEEVDPTQKKIPLPPSSLFSSLSDQITENILARVSRWKYPSLSLVSKRFRSLVSSMEIYKTRSQIGVKETCFYVCLQLHDQPYPSWFSLWAKPNQTLTKESGEISFKQDPGGNSVVPTPFSSSRSPPITNTSTISVGSEIYIFGGPYKDPSSSVRILGCRSHTWRDAPNMTMAREDACAVVLDEKIYVMGGCEIDNWFEVFDMKTQSWTALPGPRGTDDDDELHNFLRQSFYYSIVNVFEGKLHVVVDDKEYTHELKDGTWKLREKSSFLFDSVAVLCKIDTVLYCCTFSGDLMWSDSKIEGREWREIKGLGKLREHKTRGLKAGSEFDIVNYGGKLLVMWDIDTNDIKRKNKIGYAKISLESRCNGREVWGKVDCVDVLTFPQAYTSFYCLTASV